MSPFEWVITFIWFVGYGLLWYLTSFWIALAVLLCVTSQVISASFYIHKRIDGK